MTFRGENSCVAAGCKASCCFSSRITFKTKGDYEKWLSRGADQHVVEGESPFNVAASLLGGSRREDGDGSAFHMGIDQGNMHVDVIQLFGACPNLDLTTFNCLVGDLDIHACRGLKRGRRECTDFRARDGLDPVEPRFNE